MKKSTLLTFFLFLSIFVLQAQRPPFAGGGAPQGPSISGKITGILVDTASMQAVEFATIVLEDVKTQKEVNGTLTESDGNFKLQEVKTGK